MLDFNSVINRLKEKFNLKSDKDMYDFMGVTQGKYSMWKQRNKIPYEEITKLCCNENIDINYILLGKNSKELIENINFKEENQKMIEEADNKMNEIYYHILNAERLKIKE